MKANHGRDGDKSVLARAFSLKEIPMNKPLLLAFGLVATGAIALTGCGGGSASPSTSTGGDQAQQTGQLSPSCVGNFKLANEYMLDTATVLSKAEAMVKATGAGGSYDEATGTTFKTAWTASTAKLKVFTDAGSCQPSADQPIVCADALREVPEAGKANDDAFVHATVATITGGGPAEDGQTFEQAAQVATEANRDFYRLEQQCLKEASASPASVGMASGFPMS